MPPGNKDSLTTERLLGQLVAEVRALNEKMDNTNDHFRELRAHDRSEIAELRKEFEAMGKTVDEMRQYMLRVEGGKKMLFAMLSIASVLGGLVWELLSRLLPLLGSAPK